MIPAWLPVAVPWAGAALLAALPRRPAFAGAAVAFASFAAAVALAVWGGAERSPPDAFGVALLLAGASAALLVAVWGAGAAPPAGGDRFAAAAFPSLQGAQALALLAGDAAVAWIGLAVGSGAGVAAVALAPGGAGRRRAFAAAWRMLLLCGAGSALALLGVALLHRGAASSGLAELGFVLVLVGHGALAGLAPLGAWLPRASAAAPPAAAALAAGLLPPAALHAVLRAADAAGPASGALPPAALLVAAGLATAALAAASAWLSTPRAAAKGLPGRGAAGLAGLAAVGFGLGGAAGASAGVLLLLGLPFCVGASVLGGAAGGGGGPVLAALGRLSLAGMPPFAPFVALVLLFSAVAALPAAAALPLGAALLAVAAAQLGAAGREAGGPAPMAVSPDGGHGAGRLLLAAPAWALLGAALALGVALPEAVASALAGAAAGLAR